MTVTRERIRVGIIYGGRSGEHEVSVASAASIFKHLDRSRYEPVPIRIEKDGRWVLGRRSRPPRSRRPTCSRRPGRARSAASSRRGAVNQTGGRRGVSVLHGPYGEDGTVQGLLELADVPYVGAGVLGSAVGMDKAVMKKLFAADGPADRSATSLRCAATGTAIARADRRTRRHASWASRCSSSRPTSARASASPRPETTASSADAMALALQFDRKIVIEAGVRTRGRSNAPSWATTSPQASVPGEIVPSREFYDYEAKYLDEGSKLLIPAPLTDAQVARGPAAGDCRRSGPSTAPACRASTS